MHPARRTTLRLALLAAASFGILAVVPRCPTAFAAAQGGQQPAAAGQVARRVGTIKAINGNSITLAPDTGPVVTVIAQDATRFLRIAPGQKSLRDAAPAQLQDLQMGDRILVGGRLSEDAKSVMASTIVVMKHSDVEAKQEQEREAWQKHGLGGLVSAADPASGTVTISVSAPGGKKTVAIHTTKQTIVRRYAPDSVKFEDAKPGTLAQIKPGDQLRARGTRSADGSELTADEIVSGTFRNIAGTITAIDPAAGTISVLDLATKKPVVVKITDESRLHKLPSAVAERIAVRLKGPRAGASENGEAGEAEESARPKTEVSGGEASTAAAGRPPLGGGAPDLQKALSRMPAVTLAELQKGDAVMIVSTEGTESRGVTAITLLSGVEPILEASPKGGQGMVLSPWTLNSSAAEGESP
jgi:Domain of unknown function (DUF5666)